MNLSRRRVAVVSTLLPTVLISRIFVRVARHREIARTKRSFLRDFDIWTFSFCTPVSAALSRPHSIFKFSVARLIKEMHTRQRVSLRFIVRAALATCCGEWQNSGINGLLRTIFAKCSPRRTRAGLVVEFAIDGASCALRNFVRAPETLDNRYFYRSTFPTM